MTKRAHLVTECATWPYRPMPADIRKQGPWGQLTAWNHPSLRGNLKVYVASADIWIHANGQTHYMHYGSWHATVTFPGPSCTCGGASNWCIHLELAEALRGLP
jgi:hypothetical protein